MQKLNRRSLLLVGFTLFSMFFGAGNLIFPPYLGAQAGTVAWLAFVGFAVSAIGLPVIGVIAVARAGGLSELAGRVHPRFAQVFALLVYLSIGPCLAIPRTASTSFQMLAPLIGGDAMRQLIYSIVFFAAAFFVALHPEKLTSWLGRILCPTLIVLIFVLFFGCLFHPVAEHYGVPTADYASLPGLTGILNGYQTMDTLAALNFGAVIALNIRDYGIEDEQQVRRSTIRAGWIAGAMLLLVYAMLTHVGALSGAAWPGGSTGADTLSNIARGLFGPVGQVLLAAIFVIACFNTCVGLIACVGQYFHEVCCFCGRRGFLRNRRKVIARCYTRHVFCKNRAARQECHDCCQQKGLDTLAHVHVVPPCYSLTAITASRPFAPPKLRSQVISVRISAVSGTETPVSYNDLRCAS